MNGLDDFPFKQKSDVLYLGVSTGTTISHISDIVGKMGLYSELSTQVESPEIF